VYCVLEVMYVHNDGHDLVTCAHMNDIALDGTSN
jgi:hypothetical protein